MNLIDCILKHIENPNKQLCGALSYIVVLTNHCLYLLSPSWLGLLLIVCFENENCAAHLFQQDSAFRS